MRTIRRLIPALLLFAATAVGQQAGPPRNPSELLDRFERLASKADQTLQNGESELANTLLLRAGELFELEAIRATGRERTARRAARILYSYCEQNGWPTTASLDLLNGDQPEAAIPTNTGEEILCRRQEDGSWRFAAEMIDRLDGWYAGIDRVAFADETTWLRAMMPAWMRREVVLLANWQWVGLLVLILFGILGSALGRMGFFALAQRAAKSRGVELSKIKGAERPFGLVALAAIWLLGLPFLDLPPRAFDALRIATHLILMVGVVWSLFRVVDWTAEIFDGLAERTKSKLDDLLVPMVRKGLKVFIGALGIVWIADNMGMDIAALLAGLGIGGVAIALASKDTVENFFGAASILTDRPFQVGDWIIMGDIEGTVAEVGFRTTRVRTFYNSVITFPNAMLIRTAVDNLGARQYRRVKLTVGVTYDTPPDKLEAFIEGIRELIRRHPYTRKDYYHVYFHKFSDCSLDILLYLFLATPDWATELRERHRLLMDILRLARELEVEFAFPTRTLHMLQGEPAQHAEEQRVVEAWRKGQKAAGQIVETFTGSRKPPPVNIGQRPDEALGEEG